MCVTDVEKYEAIIDEEMDRRMKKLDETKCVSHDKVIEWLDSWGTKNEDIEFDILHQVDIAEKIMQEDKDVLQKLGS